MCGRGRGRSPYHKLRFQVDIDCHSAASPLMADLHFRSMTSERSSGAPSSCGFLSTVLNSNGPEGALEDNRDSPSFDPFTDPTAFWHVPSTLHSVNRSLDVDGHQSDFLPIQESNHFELPESPLQCVNFNTNFTAFSEVSTLCQCDTGLGSLPALSSTSNPPYIPLIPSLSNAECCATSHSNPYILPSCSSISTAITHDGQPRCLLCGGLSQPGPSSSGIQSSVENLFAWDGPGSGFSVFSVNDTSSSLAPSSLLSSPQNDDVLGSLSNVEAPDFTCEQCDRHFNYRHELK